jgi:hypothetical protein
MAKRATKRRVKKTGRPTAYLPEYDVVAYDNALLGATDADLATVFGVAESTLYEWKNRYPEFAEAIKRGKRPADIRVAAAVHQRATGAEWVEEQAIKCKRVEYLNGKRVLEEERVEIVEVTRRAPPDTTAGIFWLKNRLPTFWRDRQTVEHEGEPFIGGVNVYIDGEKVSANLPTRDA